MRVLVTGGAGFVGGAVAQRLRLKGHRVRILSRRSLPGPAAPDMDVCLGDLSDFDAVRAACRDVEAVVHCAAMVGLGGRYDDFYRVNVTGTGHVIKACQELAIPRLVFTSSPSVVGDGQDAEGWDETAPYPKTFDSCYSRTKAIAEELVLASNTSGLATVALRPHLVWGPGEDKLVARIIAQARAGELRRIGAFNKKVDTTYIDDAAEAHCLALEKLAPGSSVAGQVYFISQDDPRPVWDIVNGILRAAALPPVTKSVNPWAAMAAAWACETCHAAAGRAEEPKLTRFLLRQLTTAHWFDISAARRDLGYRPQVTIEAGMQRLRAWFEAKSQR